MRLFWRRMPMRLIPNLGLALMLAAPATAQESHGQTKYTVMREVPVAKPAQAKPVGDPTVSIPKLPPEDPHHAILEKLRTDMHESCVKCHAALPVSAKYSYPLGLTVTPADETLRDQLKLRYGGLVVTKVAPNSRASRSGIQEKDILLKIGETSLKSVDDLKKFEEARAGDNKAPARGMLNIRALRYGQPVELGVSTDVRFLSTTLDKSPNLSFTTNVAQPSYWIGVSIDPADEILRTHLKLPKDTGLVVTEVIKDAPAEKAGIKKNDVLLYLNDKPLKSVEDMIKIVQEAKETPISVALTRAGDSTRLAVEPVKRAQDNESLDLIVQQLGDAPVFLQGARNIIGSTGSIPHLADITGSLVTTKPHVVNLNAELVSRLEDQINALAQQNSKQDRLAQAATQLERAKTVYDSLVEQKKVEEKGRLEQEKKAVVEKLEELARLRRAEDERMKTLARIDTQLRALTDQIREIKASMEDERRAAKGKDK
jgi:membrane-associated protease RseP (regulator of RpoE activity)